MGENMGLPTEYPRISVSSFVISKVGKILLGKRKNSYGHGMWGLPGGKLDLYEEPYICSLRETLEETGMIVKVEQEFKFFSFFNREQKNHWISLLYICTPLDDSQEPKLVEPDKFFKWEWFYLSDIQPRPDLFYPLRAFFDIKKNVAQLNGYVREYGFRT